MEEKYGPQYQYSSLNNPESFRLLKIFPGRALQITTCRLFHYCLADEHPPYIALSYTWGDPALTWENMIFVDGRPFLVTANLNSALRELCFDNPEPIYVWADAICINQTDLGERSQQVLLMRQIYQCCEKTVVHLGQNWHGCDDLVPFLEDLEHALSRASVLGLRNGPLTHQELKLYNFPDPLAGSKPLSALFQRDWFSRIWVMQEAAVAKRVVLFNSSWEIEWTYLQLMMAEANSLGLRSAPRDDSGMAMYYNFIQFDCMSNLGAGDPGFEKRKLIEILQGARRSRATDPRDHVYGALGLAIEGDEPALQPRYTDSVERVYIRTAKFLVENGDGICLLYSSFMEKDPQYTLPSWTPNWASTEIPMLRVAPYGSILGKTHSGNTCFSASGERKAKMQLKTELNQLMVRGMVVGKLTHMGETHAQQTTPDVSHTEDWVNQLLGDFELVQRCLEELSTLNQHHTRYTTSELDDIAWRVLICNSICKAISPDAIAGAEQRRNFEGFQRVQWFRNASADAQQAWVAQYTGSLNDEVAAATLYSGIAQPYCRDMRRASIENGYLAQVPCLAAKDDVVFVPFGSAIPIVVRPKQDGKFLVVGESYVHGLMNGEVLEPGASFEQEIVLI